MNTVEDLGESGVLRRILEQLSEAQAATLGPGDDCAVVRFRGDSVVTSDMMIEGPDFRLAWHSGYELGRKLAATNLSDVAAMGAKPVALTVSFACPANTPVDLLAEIARGLDEACRELAPGCGVVGGDLSRAPVLVAAVTALGDMEGREPVKRSMASPGDTVAYAGDLGLAGLGLSKLFVNCADADGTAHSDGLSELRVSYPVELQAQLAPRPPIHHGIIAAQAGATAMMDVSDGLALDAKRMADSSSVQIELSSQQLEAGFGEQRGVKVPLKAMLDGGEDHGLLACFPANDELPDGFIAIGVVKRHENSESSGDEQLDSGVPGGSLTVSGEPYEPEGWDPYAEHARVAG